jgi:DNA-binding NtrC family response regulator
MRRADVRVIGATNRAEGFLRPDLRARLLRTVRLPPLRERREDIPLLIRHWLRRRGQQDPEIAQRFLRKGATGANEPRISGRLVDYVVRHPLELNVRGSRRSS